MIGRVAFGSKELVVLVIKRLFRQKRRVETENRIDIYKQILFKYTMIVICNGFQDIL